MEAKENFHSFTRKIRLVNNRPHIFIISSSEKEEPPGEPETRGRGAGEEHREQKGRSMSFFGHHIGKLLAPDTTRAEEFQPIDTELESSLEAVRKKLQMLRPRSDFEGSKISEEESKHQRFIEQRNSAQESLFEDILQFHRRFGTGLNREDLWFLHDLMKMEASHEEACSLEESVHELLECDLLEFMRMKAAERAWGQLEDYVVRFHIPFPMPPSMEDRSEPARNEKVREERGRSAQDEFLKLPAEQVAELILGNVPKWVYSYPQRDTYLWQLTILQGVAAGLAANSLMQSLSVWEENSTEILNRIQKDFRDKIEELRHQGESAADIPEILSISKELQRISKEQIPDQIWKQISAKLEVS